MKNAIILAAGKSSQLAQFTYEKPKGLFRVKGEILIRSQVCLYSSMRNCRKSINRQEELFAHLAAKDIGIDKSVIHMELSSWKISYYVTDAKNCDFENHPEQLKTGMKFLRRLHEVKADESVKIFDDVAEGKKMMAIASATKGNLAREFAELVEKVDRLYPLVKADAERLGYALVLCHNDTYEPNYLYDNNEEMYLIDWEYAGMNYVANDIGCILCRYNWTDEQIEKYLRAFVGRELTQDEHR